MPDLLDNFRYRNEKTGEPLGSTLTHEAYAELVRRFRELRDRHQPEGGAFSDDDGHVYLGEVCRYCSSLAEAGVPWPCRDGATLEGGEP